MQHPQLEGRGVLFDFIRAVPVAILVGVVPGWFWAGCLGRRGDLAGRLTYSVAFSITLVPAVTLLQVRLLGTGVTSAIAIVSIFVVLVAGLIVYLKFGPAKEPEAPVISRSALLDLPALILLAGMLALVTAMLTGAVSGHEVVLPLAVLAFLGGLLSLLGARRRAPSLFYGSRQETVGLRGSAARYVLLVSVLALVLLRSYPGPLRYDWPFPRGVDKYEHAVMTSMMLARGSFDSFMLYPPGFHLLAAVVCRLSGLEPLTAFATLAPALLLLPALSCYVLASRIWGWECGVAAAFFAGVVAGGSFQHVSQARYPNLIGAQFLLVMAVVALVGLYTSSSWRDAISLALLGSAVVLYHQVSTFYLVLLLALVAALFLPYLFLRDRKRGLTLFISLALLGIFSVLYAWDTYDLPRLFSGLLEGTRTGPGGEAVMMAMGTKQPFPFNHLLKTTSESVVWLGLSGALISLSGWRGRTEALALSTLLAWALILFAGSRTVYSAFPDRFERDLSIPVSLFAALAFVTILRSLIKARKPAAVFITSVAVLLTVAAVGFQTLQNFEVAVGSSQRTIDESPPPQVVAAGRWLHEHNHGGNILSTPYVSRASARGMLAMGDYFGVQSYTEKRLRKHRDIPPTGVKPLEEAQQALHHPADRQTKHFIVEHDIRYVVLYKHYPGISWRSFESRPDLYRTAFENSEVIILAPRKRSAGL